MNRTSYLIVDVFQRVAMLNVVALDQSLKPLPDARLDMLEADLEKELNEVGAFFPMRFVWGKKPQ